MTQNIKLDDSKDARKYQRERTEKVKDLNKSFDELITQPPEFITDENTRILYEYLAKQLNKSGYINNTDQSILLTLVINIQALESAYESLNSVGATYTTDNGMIKKNPATDVIANTSTKILSASSALGFSPASRASLINLAQVDSEDSAQKLMEMFADDE
ncbi:phage terminase small subunit P27 family [Leuconostoc citreum]|uniref:phage terminase small subunit P27 family n=1 Tax=Leuconostoc citreum TaxID=33964 RepID=UPI0021A70FC6|nr:phage terminase small subunit P27 family [Leuconostoc citreum]MCT3072142.1 phage terminase small subunit P27 family [Leuconostoc citreum]